MQSSLYPRWNTAGGVSQWSDTCTKPQVERPGTPPAPDPLGTLWGLLTKGKQLLRNQHFAYVEILKFVHLGKLGEWSWSGGAGPETN